MEWIKKNKDNIIVGGIWIILVALYPYIKHTIERFNLMTLNQLTLVYILSTLFLFDIGLIFYLRKIVKELRKIVKEYEAFKNKQNELHDSEQNQLNSIYKQVIQIEDKQSGLEGQIAYSDSNLPVIPIQTCR